LHRCALSASIPTKEISGRPVPFCHGNLFLYKLSAATAGIAGALIAARFSGGSSIAGDRRLLSSIAEVTIGGASMYGGHGSVSRTLIGALIIAVMTIGLVRLNVQPFWQFRMPEGAPRLSEVSPEFRARVTKFLSTLSCLTRYNPLQVR